MNTARILDLALAIGAGNLAAWPASGPRGESISGGAVLPLVTPDAFSHPGKPSLAVTQP